MSEGSRLKRILSFYLSNNYDSFIFIFIQALVFGLFFQVYIFKQFLPIFGLDFFIIIIFSIFLYFLIWFTYALSLSKLTLDRFSRGAISEILKYDSYSYFPITILLLVGLVLQHMEIITNNLIWFFVVGWILVFLLKTIIIFYKPPRKDISIEELGWQAKQKIIEKVSNLDPDEHIAKMYKVDGNHPVRKYNVDDELRNAVNIKNSKKGQITFISPTPLKALRYSLGFISKNENISGNLKLFLCFEKNEKMIFNKDASLFLTGWNEYKTELPEKTKTVKIRWENTIKEDIYLSFVDVSTKESKEKRKNIITIIFDGVVPESLGIYRDDFQADNVSKFFKDSIVWKNAYSQGDWTMPNFMSMATSLYLSHHGSYDPDLYSKVLSKEVTTLAEVFQKNGYNTYGYFGCHRTSPGYGHMRGYNRGIYRYTGQKPSYNNMDVTLNALNFLKKNQNTNNFLFLHYFGTHPIYYQNPNNVSSEHDSLTNMSIIDGITKQELNKDEFSYIQEIYNQKLKEIDDNIAILFDYISKYEDENTIVILASDHGSLLYDKNAKNMKNAGKDKQRTRYLEESRVKIPFMIRYPKDKRKKLVLKDDLIEGNITMMPTILDLAGLQTPKNIDGVSVFSKKAKGYTISESVFKNIYEILLKNKDFTYFLRTNRNRDTGEIYAEPGLEIFFDKSSKKIIDNKIIKVYKKEVSQILKDNKLSNVVSDKE